MSQHLLQTSRSIVLGCLLSFSPLTTAASELDNRALLETYIDVWNHGELDRLDQILAPGFERHDSGNLAADSLVKAKERIAWSRDLYGDLRLDVHELEVGAERGLMRYTFNGIYGETGKRVEQINLAMYRFAGGRIIEERVQGDAAAFLAGLGYRVVPPGWSMVPPPLEGDAAVNDVGLPSPFPGEGQLQATASQLAAAAPGKAGTLHLTTDVGFRVRLDGKELGGLPPGASIDLLLEPGEHILEAMSLAGAIFSQQSFSVEKRQQTSLEVVAPGRILANPRDSTSEDLTTGLMWQLRDNGESVTWYEAEAYCSTLELAGHDDWRLPNIHELLDTYQADSPKDFRTINGITLSGCCPWSSNTHGDLMAWIFVSYKGARYLQHRTFSGMRALCVRDLAPRRPYGSAASQSRAKRSCGRSVSASFQAERKRSKDWRAASKLPS